MPNATVNKDNEWGISISHGKLTTSNSTKTLTISTAGKYVDKDIIVTSTATKPDAGTVKASSPSITPTISSTANSDKSYNITGSATVTVSSETAGYVSSSVGTRTSGTASISGTVAGSTLNTTSVTPSPTEQTVTIGAGYYPTERTVTVKSLATITQSVPVAVDSLGSNDDGAGEGKIILASGGALKVPTGYIANDLYFSLAGLVPDDANITESESSPYILSGKTAYDKNGKLITGGIANLGNPSTTYYQTTAGVSGSKIASGKYVNQDLYIKSGSATTPATTITKVPSLSDTYDTTNKGYPMTVSGTQNVTPTVSAGWVATGTAGTITVAGTGYVTQSAITPNTTLASGATANTTNLTHNTYIKIGKGYYHEDRWYKVRQYSAADFASGNIEIAQQTGTSVVGKSTASVKSGSASVTADTITNTVTIGALSNGKYTISASGSKTVGGTATAGWVSSVAGATISASGTLEMTAAGAPTVGTATANTTTWKLTIPIETAAGYNASKQTTNATLDIYNGAYTVS